uniref:Melanocortin 2 receptor accessory protein 2b n=1 Tax=Labrus bergylta TaxID=56723 RepID=A0A3Q3FZG1_9LABR
MSAFHNRSQTSARRSDYVWQYEYYDDEEPVSFEGLKAHRYSIVIGFWVGLAVFVIFMFFVLTLLTKTGAPHQENPDSAEKRHRPGSCLVDIDGPQDENDKAFSRPLLSESRSYFHFYINEEDRGQRKLKPEEKTAVKQQESFNRPREENKAERENDLFSHFNIPNFVNLEQSSNLGEEDLLYEPSVILERQAHSQDTHCDIH